MLGERKLPGRGRKGKKGGRAAEGLFASAGTRRRDLRCRLGSEGGGRGWTVPRSPPPQPVSGRQGDADGCERDEAAAGRRFALSRPQREGARTEDVKVSPGMPRAARPLALLLSR